MPSAINPSTDSLDKPVSQILIVDDNEMMAQAFARVLASANYQTLIAFNGADALEYAGTQQFAAAFVDIHLPDMNGLIVAQKLREMFGVNTPIIVVSGDTSIEVIKALPHVGATYFLSKPINTLYLLERLKEWIPGNDPNPGNNPA